MRSNLYFKTEIGRAWKQETGERIQETGNPLCNRDLAVTFSDAPRGRNLDGVIVQEFGAHHLYRDLAFGKLLQLTGLSRPDAPCFNLTNLG